MLTRYRCGHVGKKVEGKKGVAFIRVAEIRKEKVWVTDKVCPDCEGSHE